MCFAFVEIAFGVLWYCHGKMLVEEDEYCSSCCKAIASKGERFLGLLWIAIFWDDRESLLFLRKCRESFCSSVNDSL